MEIDIQSTSETLSRYSTLYNTDHTITNIFDEILDFDKYEKIYMNEIFIYDDNVCNVKSDMLNKIVKVKYFPYSQKYIDYYDYQLVMGKIFFVDEIGMDAFMYYDKIVNNKNIRVITSLNRDYCSYFGDSRGYDIIIYFQ